MGKFHLDLSARTASPSRFWRPLGLAVGDWLRIWFRELLLARPHTWQIFQSPFTVLFATTWGGRAELDFAIARLIRLIPAHIKAYLE